MTVVGGLACGHDRRAAVRRPAAQPGAERGAGGDLATLALAPFLFSGAQAINTAAKVCVFIVLVASYDLLLGYTGIVSFAHTMFYGLGGYGVGLALYGWGATWPLRSRAWQSRS